MQGDRHQEVCRIIDQSLIATASVAPSIEDAQILREHLLTCAQCNAYLEASRRAIATLGGFAFEVDPGLHGKVLAALTMRAEQLDRRQKRSQPTWWHCLVAVVLTVAGSFVVSDAGRTVSAAFHIAPKEMGTGLMAFWITPSICFCLLFFILPLSGGMNKKGISS
jgi:hypothetical protein